MGILLLAAFVFIWMPIWAVFGKPGPVRRLFRYMSSAIAFGFCVAFAMTYLIDTSDHTQPPPDQTQGDTAIDR